MASASSTAPAAAEPASVPILEGDGLRLRPLVTGDADDLFAIHSDPAVMRYWSTPAWTRREDAERRIADLAASRARSGSFAWALTLEDDPRVAGTVSLFAIDLAQKRAEVGYALASRVWGRGHATRMLAKAIEFAFGRLGLERLEADIDPRNARSCRLVERLGFRREGLLRERWRVGEEIADSAIYGLLAREFPPASGSVGP